MIANVTAQKIKCVALMEVKYSHTHKYLHIDIEIAILEEDTVNISRVENMFLFQGNNKKNICKD